MLSTRKTTLAFLLLELSPLFMLEFHNIRPVMPIDIGLFQFCFVEM